MDKLYNVGAYVRLSMEAASYESDSVENQVSMLSKFIAMMPGWVEQKFYVDDGFSGVSFQRPAFQEMIEDVRNGVINLVLVKDLSRFGRNYLEAGHYLEELLPSLGCRFVAFQDGIDTEDGENDVMAFLNAMNDYYVKNHSDRIRSVMAAKAKDGQKISGHAPYGYRRSLEDNTRLVIDEYSAGIIRRIFEMRKDGTGVYSIAKTLNSESILPPMIYYYSIVGKDDSHVKAKVWRPSTLNMMLKDELYIGNAVQLEKKVVSYRDKREVMRPADEWIRVDGAFPAIIEKALWDEVQAVNRKAGEHLANKRPPEVRLFTGVAVCADCGAKMVSIKKIDTGKKGKTNEYVNYVCGKFHSTGSAECTRHSVGQLTLAKIVLYEIDELIHKVKLNEKAVIKSLTERLIGNRRTSQAARKKETAMLKQRIRKLETAISTLYEERYTEQIPEDAFLTQIQTNETERLQAEERLAELETTEQEAESKMNDIQNWIRLIKEYATVTELNRDLLLALVDKIEIGEGRTVNGVRERDVVIHYKFIGTITDCREGEVT
jgi:DNA invertase Pin-like site-specific DNA recombinase/two-component sensor histidine kinase